MNTQQPNYKLNNQSGYPFLSITLENNEIGLTIRSFTSLALGTMSIMAYSPCFQNDMQLSLEDNKLLIQVGIDQIFDRPFKMHLLDRESRFLLRAGLLTAKTAVITLDKNFIYSINNYCLVSQNALQIDLSYRPDYYRNHNKTA
jgi:hypothetical protein